MRNSDEIWRLVDAHQDDFIAPVGPGLGDAGALLHRGPFVRRTYGDAGGEGIPGDPRGRRHSDRGDGGGGRGRTGDRDPGRIRRAARLVAGGRRRGAKAAAGDGFGHGCGHNLLGSASMLAATAVKDYLAANGYPGPGALLRLSGRGGRRGQGVHGPGRGVRRCGCGDFLASVVVLRGQPGEFAGQYRGSTFRSTGGRRMPLRRRIWGAARWMRSS